MPAKPERVYLDACAVIAYIQDEANRSHMMQCVLDDGLAGRLELVTSTLSIAEVAFYAGERPAVLVEASKQIDALWVPSSPIKLIDMSQALARDARQIMRKAVEKGISCPKPPDAIHLASAARHGCTQLFTYEEASTRRAWERLTGIEVCEPISKTPQLDWKDGHATSGTAAERHDEPEAQDAP